MLNRRSGVALASAISAVTTLSLVPAQASYAVDGAFPLMNPGSGNLGCVQPRSAEKGVQLTTAPCQLGNQLQQWHFDLLGDGSYHIRNNDTDFCMDAVSNTDFAVVKTWDCNAISNEKWSIPNGPSRTVSFQVISRISTGGAPCLDVQGGASTTQTKPIDVFHCTSNNLAQLFLI
jgi:hypothetical protein